MYAMSALSRNGKALSAEARSGVLAVLSWESLESRADGG